MKKFILFLVVVFGISVSKAQISKAEIIATGLTCSMCSNAIYKQLNTIDGVDKVEIDLNSNTFTVFLKIDSVVTPKTLKDNVEKAGFFVGSMVISLPFDNVSIADNTTFTEKNMKFIFIDSKATILRGETKVKVLDKGFLTQKEFKKLSKSYSKFPTYLNNNEDDFHLKVI